MKALKNIVVGFLVSFVGSIPLGYLNIVGFEIYTKKDLLSLLGFLIGVIIVEGMVIYATLLFAKKLSENEKLLKFIEIFSIVFMFTLAAVFFLDHSKPISDSKKIIFAHAPLIIGLLFSALNFIQIPFWLGWNLYLINNKYIQISSNIKLFYLLGTISGTFCGMLSFILMLDLLSNKGGILSANTIGFIIPIFFFAMGCFQLVKHLRKK